jgi:hypothetical protein
MINGTNKHSKNGEFLKMLTKICSKNGLHDDDAGLYDRDDDPFTVTGMSY